MKNSKQFYRVRATHNTDRQEFVDYVTGEDGRSRRVPAPLAWRVGCQAHAHAGTCATMQIEKLDGNWTCPECEKFDWTAKDQLRKALTHENYSHTRIIGHYRSSGVVYHNDPTSPSGKQSAGGFDANCAEAMALVNELTGTPNSPHPSDR
jgi:rubredoxin